jgi:hypothetical protein
MATAQFALFAREQDTAIGARFAVEMLRNRANRPRVVNSDCEHFDLIISRWVPLMMTAFAATLLTGNLAWTWSCPKLIKGTESLLLEGHALYPLEK